MSNFIKSIFKPSSQQSRGNDQSSHPQPIQWGGGDSPIDYRPSSSSLQHHDLEALADLLREEMDKKKHDGGGNEAKASHRGILDMLKGKRKGGSEGNDLEDGKTMKQILGLLQEMQEEKTRGRVSPYRPSQMSSRDTLEDGSPVDEGVYGQALVACEAALAYYYEDFAQQALERVTSGRDLVLRCIELLEAQRDELVDFRQYAQGKQLPTLVALTQIYRKVKQGMQDLMVQEPAQAGDTSHALALLLQDGPDYLIDIAIIDAMIWQAEVIDPKLGSDIRRILNEATAEKGDLYSFRKAAEKILRVAEDIPDEDLDDELGKDAYQAVKTLVKQLQARVAVTSRQSTVSSSSIVRPTLSTRDSSSLSVPLSRSATPQSGSITPTPGPSGQPTRTPSQISSRSSVDTDFQKLDVNDLQTRYGTGQTTGPTTAGPSAVLTPSYAPTPSRMPSSNATPTPASEDVPSPVESEQSIWEYGGQMLTRSALELVLRQEQLAVADSSGQYAGEVSWDDVRNAWIPKWAEKLKAEDVAEGEIPTTNPADYKVRDEDAWGNKIGWYEGRMYYEEDPTFELK